MRRNGDERLRDLERRAEAGDEEAKEELLELLWTEADIESILRLAERWNDYSLAWSAVNWLSQNATPGERLPDWPDLVRRAHQVENSVWARREVERQVSRQVRSNPGADEERRDLERRAAAGDEDAVRDLLADLESEALAGDPSAAARLRDELWRRGLDQTEASRSDFSRNELLLLCALRYAHGPSPHPPVPTGQKFVRLVVRAQGVSPREIDAATRSLVKRGFVLQGGQGSRRTIWLTSAGVEASRACEGVEIPPLEWRSTFPLGPGEWPDVRDVAAVERAARTLATYRHRKPYYGTGPRGWLPDPAGGSIHAPERSGYDPLHRLSLDWGILQPSRDASGRFWPEGSPERESFHFIYDLWKGASYEEADRDHPGRLGKLLGNPGSDESSRDLERRAFAGDHEARLDLYRELGATLGPLEMLERVVWDLLDEANRPVPSADPLDSDARGPRQWRYRAASLLHELRAAVDAEGGEGDVHRLTVSTPFEETGLTHVAVGRSVRREEVVVGLKAAPFRTRFGARPPEPDDVWPDVARTGPDAWSLDAWYSVPGEDLGHGVVLLGEGRFRAPVEIVREFLSWMAPWPMSEAQEARRRARRNPADDERRDLERRSAAGDVEARVQLARLEEAADGAAGAFQAELERLVAQANGHEANHLHLRLERLVEAIDYVIDGQGVRFPPVDDSCPKCEGVGRRDYPSLEGPIGVSAKVECGACGGAGTTGAGRHDRYVFSDRHGILLGDREVDVEAPRPSDRYLRTVALVATLPVGSSDPSEVVVGVNVTRAELSDRVAEAVAWTWPRGRIVPGQNVDAGYWRGYWRPSWIGAWAKKKRTVERGLTGGVYGVQDRVRVPVNVVRRWLMLREAGDF